MDHVLIYRFLYFFKCKLGVVIVNYGFSIKMKQLSIFPSGIKVIRFDNNLEKC